MSMNVVYYNSCFFLKLIYGGIYLNLAYHIAKIKKAQMDGGKMAPQAKINYKQADRNEDPADRESWFSVTTLLTCTSHGGGVFDSSVEAFVAVTDGGGLVMAGAMWRTLGAFRVPSICLEEAGPTGWRKNRGGGESHLNKVNVPRAISFPPARIHLIQSPSCFSPHLWSDLIP